MDHYFPDVPGLGNVAVSRHAQARMVEDGISEHDFKEALLTAPPPPMGKTFSGEKRMASGWSFFDNQRHSRERCWQRPCIVCDQPLALRSDPSQALRGNVAILVDDAPPGCSGYLRGY